MTSVKKTVYITHCSFDLNVAAAIFGMIPIKPSTGWSNNYAKRKNV